MPGELRKDASVTFSQAELNQILAQHERYAMLRGGTRALLKYARLDGLNLANRNLKEAEFAGASFVRANLFGSNLTRTSLYCADLRRCDLRNANLTGADMRGASLNGANLSYAVLDQADLRAAVMMKMGPDGFCIIDHVDTSHGGRGVKPVGVDFSNCSMRHASFGNAQLDGANFSGALLDGAKFQGAKLINANFRGAVLTGVNLKDLAVTPEALEGCVLDVTPQAQAKFAALKARLDAHQEWILSGGRRGAAAVLDDEDLRPLHKLFAGRQLTGLSARRTIAIGIDFSQCELQGAKFDGADLREANFSQAELSGASLRGAKIAHAKFHSAKLNRLNLLSGEIVLPDLSGTESTEGQFVGAILDEAVANIGLLSAAFV